MLKKISSYTLFTLLAVVLSAAPGLASTRLAVLVSSGSQPYLEMLSGLQLNLKHTGTAVDYDVHHLDNEAIKAEISIERIKVEKPDIIITLGALAFNKVADEIDDIPIVAGMILNQEKIQNYPNATGVVLEIPIDLQFAWLKKFFPGVQNVGVLYNPDQNKYIVQQASAQAQSMGLNLVTKSVSSPRILPTALKELVGKAEVLWGLSDVVVLNKKTARNILLFSFRNKIPFVGLSNAWVKAGAYYALDRDYQDIGVQCGEIVNEIIGGAPVETIAPAFPRDITYSLNTRTAKKMNMNIDQSLINNAENAF